MRFPIRVITVLRKRLIWFGSAVGGIRPDIQSGSKEPNAALKKVPAAGCGANAMCSKKTSNK